MVGNGIPLPVQRLNACDGHFDVVCAADEDGVSRVSRQAIRAPFHLAKSYWDGHALLVQCVNCTAGVFAGDKLRIDVRVEPGARVLLTSPSAHRIHTMSEGEAVLAQRFVVGEGAWLEVMPELFIPQAGCRYAQSTRIDLAEKAELFFVETFAPGRVARGEVFAFDRVDWTTDIFRAGRRVLRERYRLRREGDSLWALEKRFPAAYHASCFIATSSGMLSDGIAADIESLGNDKAHIGATHLDDALWIVKILAADSMALRSTLWKIREQLRPHITALCASSRKL